MLSYLIDHRDRVVTKEELLEEVLEELAPRITNLAVAREIEPVPNIFASMVASFEMAFDQA